MQGQDNLVPRLDLETILDETLLDVLEEIHLPDLLDLPCVEVGQAVPATRLSLRLIVAAHVGVLVHRGVVGLELINPLRLPNH